MRGLMRGLIVGLFASGCANSGPAGPTRVHTETISDSGATLLVSLTYEATAPREVELVMSMRVSGMQETEKLVSTVLIKGFNVGDGALRWTGFVLPRQAETHRVKLMVPEGMDEARAVVSLVRSADSEVLLREELEFVVSESGALTLLSEL